MKTLASGILRAGLLVMAICCWHLNGQDSTPTVEAVAETPPPLNLPLVAPKALPETGNFYSAANIEWPPLPFNPLATNLNVPVYSIAQAFGKTFGAPFYLIDDRAWYLAKEQAGKEELAYGMIEAAARGKRLDSFGIKETLAPKVAARGIVPTGTDLLLDIEDATNGVVLLTIYNPDSLTNNPVWDLFGINLLSEPAWTWLTRTEPGQTNLLVQMLSEVESYYRLAATNDTDADGLTDAFEELASHSSAITNDSDGDGLLDGWEWKHFGSFTQTGSSDFDSDGLDNAYEQSHGTDPNTLSFTAHIGYGQSSVTNPVATIAMLGGVPSELAVMVDGTNFDNPNWQTFTTSPVVPLPDADGEHLVWVALRGRLNATAWQGFGVTLDRVAPALVITSPTNDTTSKSIIQVTGYSTDTVWSVSCTLSNAAGVQTNLSALATKQDFGTVTTNHFQCFDVELTNGVNKLTLQVSDLAGNMSTTNLSITFDTTGDSNAPVLTVLWPQDGSSLGADTFTLRAHSDDETANISAMVIGPSGATNEYFATVERNGTVWVEGIALVAGTNQLTMTATDAASNTCTTNLTLIRGGVTVTIQEPVNLNDPFVTVSGTVSDGSYSVWVNGVQATVTGTNWTAVNVSVASGSAVFVVGTIPNGGSTTPGNRSDPTQNNPSDPNAVQVAIQPEKLEEAKLVHGEWSREVRENILLPDESPGLYLTQHNWRYDEKAGGYAERVVTSPGSTNGVRYWLNPDGTECYMTWQTTTANVVSTNWVDLTQVFWQGFAVNGPMADGLWRQRTSANWGTSEKTWSARDVNVLLRTGGRLGLNAMNLFGASATAQEKTATGDRDIPAQADVIASFGNQGADAQVRAIHPDSIELSVKVKAPAAYYTFTVGATKHKLKVRANGVEIKPNEAGPYASFIVGQYVEFTQQFDPALLEQPQIHPVKWTLPGTYVNESNQPCTNCSVNYTNNPDLLTNQTTHGWWVSGGPKHPGESYLASLTETLSFTNGQQVEITSNGRFNMFRPLPTFNAETRGAVAADTNSVGSIQFEVAYLHFGVGIVASNFVDVGIFIMFTNAPLLEKIGYSTNDLTYGDHFITQVITRHTKLNEWDGTNCHGEQADESGLDNQLKLNNKNFSTDQTGGTWSDSPGSPLGIYTTWKSNEDSFKSTLMFLPAKGDNRKIAVPMYEVTWGWSGSAKTNNATGGYDLMSHSAPPPQIQETINFPYWTNIVSRITIFTTNSNSLPR